MAKSANVNSLFADMQQTKTTATSGINQSNAINEDNISEIKTEEPAVENDTEKNDAEIAEKEEAISVSEEKPKTKKSIQSLFEKPKKPKKQPHTFSIPEDMFERLEDIAEEYRISVSEVVTRLLTYALDDE